MSKVIRHVGTEVAYIQHMLDTDANKKAKGSTIPSAELLEAILVFEEEVSPLRSAITLITCRLYE